MKDKITCPLVFWPVLVYFIISRGVETCFIALLLIVLHESSHIVSALLSGFKLERIKMFPIGQRAFIRDIYSADRLKQVIIYASGIVFNLMVFCLLYFCNMQRCAEISIYIALFNLLPAFPFDCGNILLTFMGKFKGDINSARILFKISKLVSRAIIVCGIVFVVLYPYNLDLLVIGLYMLTASERVYKEKYKSILHCLAKHSEPHCRKVNLLYAEGVFDEEIVNCMVADRVNVVLLNNNGFLHVVHQKNIIYRKRM